MDPPTMTPMILIGAFIFTLVNFLRSASAKDWDSVKSAVIAWVVGIAAVFTFAQSDFADQIKVMGLSLAQANVFTKVIFGLMATSLFGVVHTAIQAIDGTQSAALPKWGGDPPPS